MLRDPAIHIKRSDLLRICKKEGITFPDDFVNSLFAQSVKHKLHNRVIITTKAGASAKVARTTSTRDDIVAQFNRVYSSAMSEHHINTAAIRKGTRPYLTMKEVATSAVNFAEEFDIKSIEEAFKYYLDLGIKLLGKNFSIYRLKGADNKIRTRYMNLNLIFEDKDPEGTKKMAEAWAISLKTFHGLEMDINDDQYASMVLARQQADKAGAKYQDWIDAQFDRWTFMNSMPEFSQLYGDNAGMNYVKYMAGKEKEFKPVKKDGKKIPIQKVKRQRSGN